MTSNAFSTNWTTLNKFWSISSTYKTLWINFVFVQLLMGKVPFPSTTIRSPLHILTFDTCDLSNSLKSFSSWVMRLVEPLSTNKHSLELLLEKHVATNNCSSSCWTVTWVSSFGWIFFFQIRTWCCNLSHFSHLTLGLLQHLKGGWSNLPQCLQGGNSLFLSPLLLWVAS